ncbi:MAG: hypothetical protein ACREX0_08395, partial [Noviherbaspirillum sp.]
YRALIESKKMNWMQSCVATCMERLPAIVPQDDRGSDTMPTGSLPSSAQDKFCSTSGRNVPDFTFI